MENSNEFEGQNSKSSKSDPNLYALSRVKRESSILSSISQATTNSLEEYPELRTISQVQSKTLDIKEISKENSDHEELSLNQNKLSLVTAVICVSKTCSTRSSPDFLEDAESLLDDLCEVTIDAGRIIKNEVIEGFEELNKPEEFADYSWVDGLWGLFSAATFICDLSSDVFLSMTMEKDPEAKYWSFSTLLLAVIPLLIQNMFSLYWYWFDAAKSSTDKRNPDRKSRPAVWCLRVICHAILLAPVLRQLDVIYYGIKSTKVSKKNSESSCEWAEQTEENDLKLATKEQVNEILLTKNSNILNSKQAMYRDLWLHAECDSAALDLLGTLLQDAPQIVLQLYIMNKTLTSLSLESQLSHTMITQIASISVSLITMAWTVTGFVRAVRLPTSGLRPLSPLEIVLLTLAHFTAIAPQVGCFALLASKQLVACITIAGLHWLIATISIFLQFLWLPITSVREAIFVHDMRKGTFAWLDDVAFSAALGIAFLFTFVDVDGAAPILQAVVFCIFRVLEQIVFITIWYFSTLSYGWWHWIPYVLVSVLFVFSLCFSVLFYWLVDPKTKTTGSSFSRSRHSSLATL